MKNNKRIAKLGLFIAFAACDSSADDASLNGSDTPHLDEDEALGSTPEFEPGETEPLSRRMGAPVDGETELLNRKIVQERTSRVAPGVVTSIDHGRMAPSFFLAGRAAVAPSARAQRVDLVARDYLARYKDVYDLGAESLASASVESVHERAEGGRIVRFSQVVEGRDVYETRMAFAVDPNLDLVAISGNLQPLERTRVGQRWSRDSLSAIATAVGDIMGRDVPVTSLRSTERSDDGFVTRFVDTERANFRLPQPAMVREVFYPVAGELIPAYAVSLEISGLDSVDSRAYEYVVSARDGEILERQNRTFSDKRLYRVWVDKEVHEYRPKDGPHADLSPHPTGSPDDHVKIVGNGFRRRIAKVDGLNTNPEGGFDPWLLPKAKDLLAGNNVSAYADHFSPDGFSEGDVAAFARPSGTFESPWFPEDGAFGTTDQIEAAIVQLFFVNNWLHDWYYDSGFTEAAGNAQMNNYGRGGVEGDPLRAEAQDTRGENRNNANMSTPSDGLSPRMQMYVWDGVVTPIGETFFTITAPESIAGDYEVQGSLFGVDDLVATSGSMVFVDDGVDVGTDGCEPITGDLTGQIALIDRGACTFVSKALNAVAAGASGVVIVNNDSFNPDVLPPLGGTDPTIEIPVVGVSFATGEVLRGSLATDAVAGDISRAGRDRGPDVDGTIDNAIVAHEWGHYLHHRLTICETVQCGAMSEGWADFVALHMMVRDYDDLHGAFAAATWATQSSYFGIRRAPYSVEPSFNAVTFGHIADSAALPVDQHPMLVFGPNSEIHNAGEIWASALFDAYINLIEAPHLTFEEAQRRMGNYIVEGMILAPVNPTFTEQRDSILAAVAASDERDLEIIARAFAQRGMGTGAVSPPIQSVNFEETVENFDLAGNLQIAGVEFELTDDCDGDGNFDGGETGLLTVSLVNAGPVALESSSVSLVNVPAIVLDSEGLAASVDALGPYAGTEVTLEVTLSEDVATIETVDLTVATDSPASFETSDEATISMLVNYDDVPNASSNDNVESNIIAWTREDLSPSIGFERLVVEGDSAWHADDPGAPGDQLLISPPLVVGDEGFVVRFEHRYAFEADTTFWDGAVIEYSTDGGATWVDVADLVDPGYGGVLSDISGNPLGGRDALVGTSVDYPSFGITELDFGTAFSGQEVMIRFHVGSDVVVGAPGWDIDNLEFDGILNTPFSVIVPDEGVCTD